MSFLFTPPPLLSNSCNLNKKTPREFRDRRLKFIKCFYFYTSSADFNGIFKNSDTLIAPGLPGHFGEAKYSIKINS
jgi:hypothetical protein